MSKYEPLKIEPKWQEKWEKEETYHSKEEKGKKKFYVLDMFPYPSGEGLHVGHPLGYIASDIVARYKRLMGYAVLHPMGFDSFGLPTEQYAIQTGKNPIEVTQKNIRNFKKQLQEIGLSFDWSREIRTSDPKYYKWTQWIFMQLFNSWFDSRLQKALPIESLIALFEERGNKIEAVCDADTPVFSAKEWNAFSEQEKGKILLHYRLTYLSETWVNWCPEMGTVLANDEVKDGLSERGGYAVERRKMRQWMMRINAYGERLLKNLEKLNWSHSLKQMQINWIGKSKGADIYFKVKGEDLQLTTYTTRPDTLFGVTYLVIAPEHEKITTLIKLPQEKQVLNYIQKTIHHSERDRVSNVKNVSGVFTGSYAIHPITGKEIPIWISDYVLSSYGTGIVMAVPSSDERDYKFAKKYQLPIKYVIAGSEESETPYQLKHGKIIHSDFLNGYHSEEAMDICIEYIKDKKIGKPTINYKIRDAVFSRQRYWGEPVPIYFKNGTPHLIEEEELPLVLPHLDNYKPTSTGTPPLGRAKEWKYKEKYPYELTTMPSWAGSNWYFLRYMDPHNPSSLVGKEKVNYWKQVDLYVGGTEHATGHLLYARFWSLFLFDRGFIPFEEPFTKIVNQGMIQSNSALIYKLKKENTFISKGLTQNYPKEEIQTLKIDIHLVKNNILQIEKCKEWRPEYKNATFVLEEKKYICGSIMEKMSKSRFNVISPNEVIQKYGTDTLRLYEMFLGPIEQSKPWDTQGIEGVHRFLKKLWSLFFDKKDNFFVTDESPSKEELKILQTAIKKITTDIENLSLNTSVSALMICVNHLRAIQCRSKEVLGKLLIITSPFAPHICEELWQQMGHKESISKTQYPLYEESYLKEEMFTCPISINGKTRMKVKLPLHLSKKEITEIVLKLPELQKWIASKTIKRIIIVEKKIINIVL